jgi:hypothetical protein
MLLFNSFNILHAQGPPLCTPPTPLLNGNFEAGSCAANNNCSLGAFNLNGCAANWFGAIGTPDLCDENGNSFASMNTEGLVGQGLLCGTEAIVQTLSLVVGCRYNLEFKQKVKILNGSAGVAVNIYLASGFVPSNLNGLDPCPTPPNAWTQVGQIPAFNSQNWVTNNQFSFLATTANPQLLFFPTPTAGATNSINVEWHLDDVSVKPCPSPLTPDFTVNNTSGNTFQFNDATTGGTPVEWCWDFGDGNYSSLQNPVHTYTGSGPFTVCLNIRDANGCHDKVCETIGEPCNCGTANQIVQGTTNWNSTIQLRNNLLVPPGATLNISGAAVNVSPGCAIRVQQGGRVNISGSNLTSACLPGRWEGIIVFGNGFATQNAASQGVVDASGSTIQWARTAINCPGVFFAGGGMVSATGVNFTNNIIGVDIGPYPTFTPGSNSNRFEAGCTFSNSEVGIQIAGTEGVLVRGNTFQNLSRFGIVGGDYTATIQANQFLGTIPTAVNVQHSTPLGLTQDFLVEGNQFSNTFSGFFGISFGLNASGVGDLEVRGNTFNNTGFSLGIGGPSEFNVEGNNFNNNTVAWNGMVLNQTGGGLNSSRCNTFGNVAVAKTAVWGDNGGYEFIQETYLPNAGIVGDVSLFAFQGGTASVDDQGAVGDPVYNLFQDNQDILSGGQNPFDYYYPTPHSILFPALRPQCDVQLENCFPGGVANNYDAIGQPLPIGKDPDGCLNLPGIGEFGEGGPLLKLPAPGESVPNPLTPNIPGMGVGTAAGEPLFPNLSCETEACLPTIRAKITALEALVDGGSTAALISDLQSEPAAQPTRQSLLTASPYLSDEVMLAMLANAKVPTSTMQDVLLANGPVSAAVMTEAQGKISAATVTALHDLQSTMGVSPRGQLNTLLKDLRRIRQRVVSAWVQAYRQQRNQTALEALLANDGSPTSLRKLFAAKLQAGNFTGAQAQLNSLPTATASDADFVYTQQINLYRMQEANFALSKAQEDELYEIAYGPTPEAAYARALITAMTGFHFEPEMPEELGERSAGEQGLNHPNGKNWDAGTFAIVPNPATHEIRLELPKADQPYAIQIIDTNGRLVLRQIATHGSIINVGELGAGIYFVTAKSNGETLRSKLVINR